MRPTTLIPIRVKSDGSVSVGDDEDSLRGYDHGFTRAVIYVTAESVFKSEAFHRDERRAVAESVDEALVEYDSFQEEVNNPLGRTAVDIALDEGPVALKELEDEVPRNPYLVAAVEGISVREAVTQDDVESAPFYIEDDGELYEVTRRHNALDIVSVEIEKDGEVLRQDMREFTPSTEWVRENWDTIGPYRYNVSDTRTEYLERLEQFARDEPEGELVDITISDGKNGATAHFVKGVETSPVKGESAQLKYACGRTARSSSVLRVNADDATLENLHICGNCEGAR